MIHNIFNHKVIILSISILIILSTACFFLYKHKTTEYQEEPTESATIIQKWQSSKSPKDNSNITPKNRVTTTSISSNAELPSTAPQKDLEPILNFHELPEETQQRIFDEFYTRLNLEPPPIGYDYLWKEIDVPELDVNGKPILHKIGDPIIELEMGEAFTPTLEEYELLQVYDAEIGWQTLQGETAKVEELKKARNELYEQSFRIRPKLGMILWVAPKAEKEADPNKDIRLAEKALKNKLIEEGYAYLIPILEETGGIH